MNDITDRLRRWTHAVDAAPASDLMDDAANEIERLRLTDAEREAIQAAAVIMDTRNRLGGPVMFRGSERAATLRGLLERTSDSGSE